MNAQEVIAFLKIIDGYRQHVHTEFNGDVFIPRIGVLPENKALFDEMFELAKVIEPSDWYRGGNDRGFWIWTNKGSYEEFVKYYKGEFTHYATLAAYINGEEAELNNEEMKAVWQLRFPDDKVWFHINLAEFEGHRALYIDNKRYFASDTLDISCEQMDVSPLLNWIIDEERKVIKMVEERTYTEFIEKNLSYHHRSGYTNMATYWKYVPEHRERLFGKINSAEFDEFLNWDGNKDCGWEQMSSKDYFDICNGLYDLLGLKDEYPIHRKDNEPMTSKDYYKAYAAMYSSVKSFIELEETSYEAFKHFVEEGQTEHHTWEVCLTPSIHLYPEIIKGRFFISLCFDHDDYDKLIHLCLEMKKKGFPIIKPKEIEERMGEERLISIIPEKTSFAYRNGRGQKLKFEEHGYLPNGSQEEFVKEIHWFPVGEWNLETSDNQIKIGCPRCGCDKKKIIYQNAGPIVRLICPECRLAVDDREVVNGRFDDIFKFWNWMSYSSQQYSWKAWEKYIC